MNEPVYPIPNTLYIVYQNIFASGDLADTVKFQELAAACLRTGVRVGTIEYEAFREFLIRKSNDPDWNPSAEQLEGLAYLLGTDRNTSLVKSWEGDPTW